MAEAEPNAEMSRQTRSGAKGPSATVLKGHRHLTKARVIGGAEVLAKEAKKQSKA